MSFAKNTPVHFLPGIGSRTAQVLHDLEIHTAGQLNNVPDKILIELFGPSIRSILNMLEITPKPKNSTPAILRQTTSKTKKGLVQRLRLASQFVMML